ncbi:MAG: hypothetical protein ACK4R8_10595 [Thiobacillus sp.]
MNILISIASVYLALCAVLPAIIGWRRGLSRGQIAVISITGATLGWTGYGVLVAWMLALLDDPPDQGIRFSVTVYWNVSHPPRR